MRREITLSVNSLTPDTRTPYFYSQTPIRLYKNILGPQQIYEFSYKVSST
jgi:hypothetical protein